MKEIGSFVFAFVWLLLFAFLVLLRATGVSVILFHASVSCYL